MDLMIESFSGRRGRRVDGQNYSSIKQLSRHLDAFDGQVHEDREEEQVLDTERHQENRQQVKDDAHIHYYDDDDESISVEDSCNSLPPKVKHEHIESPVATAAAAAVDSVSDRSSKNTLQADDLSQQWHHHHHHQQQQQQQQADEVQCTSSDKSEQLVGVPCDTVCGECTSNNIHCVLDTQITPTLYCNDSSDEVCSCCSSHDKSEQYLASTFYFQPHDYEDSQDEDEENEPHDREDDENCEDEGESYSQAVTWQVKHKLKRSANWLLRFFSR